MTILIGILLTLCTLALLIPFILPVVLFTIVVTCIVLWLCPSLRKHIREQESVYDEIKNRPYIMPEIEDIPNVVLYDMVSED